MTMTMTMKPRLTEAQLSAIETGVLSVKVSGIVNNYRILVKNLETMALNRDAELVDQLAAMKELASNLVYTIRSGIVAASNVEALTQRAKDLGAYP